jgi:hypothetical protein
MLWLLFLLACSATPASSSTEEGSTVNAQPTEIRVSGVADYNRLSAKVAEIQRGGAREAGVVVVLEAGTYTQPLKLSTQDLPLDITIRGDGQVWFDGAEISVDGRSVTVESVGFRGESFSGSLLSVRAAGDVVVRKLTVQDAVLMQPSSQARPAGPAGPQKGKRRVQARGKRPRPRLVMTIETTGEGGVLLQDIDVSNLRYNGTALINVRARPGREVVLQGLAISELPDVETIWVSPGTTVITR